MRQFLDLVRENMALREKVEAGIKAANKNFVIARAGMSGEVLKTALMMPKQSVELQVGERNVMSVDIPVFETKTRTADANDIYSYWLCLYVQRSGRSCKVTCRYSSGYVKAGRNRKGMPS